MVAVHLKQLIEIGSESYGYIGINSYSWATSVLSNNVRIDPDLDRKFDCYGLLDYCNDHKNDDFNRSIAIVSWGV